MAEPDILTRIYSSLKNVPVGPSNPQAIKEFVLSFTEGILGITLVGTETNDDADPGFIGEFKDSGIVTTGVLTSGAQANITSIDLTAGDWEVFGYGGIVTGAGTNLTGLGVGSSAVSATLGNDFFGAAWAPFVPGTGVFFQNAIPTLRYSLAAALATIYLVVFPIFTVAAPTGIGRISARRMR
jgi:hypothetical protein